MNSNSNRGMSVESWQAGFWNRGSEVFTHTHQSVEFSYKGAKKPCWQERPEEERWDDREATPAVYPSLHNMEWIRNAPCHKANIVSNRFREYVRVQRPPHLSDLNPAEQLWDVAEQEITGMYVQPKNVHTLCVEVMSSWIRMSVFLTSCGDRVMRSLF